MIQELTIEQVLGTTQAQIAGMNEQGLHDFRIAAALASSRESKALEEADSPIGQRILQRRKDDLNELRTKYYRIQVSGHIDSDIVRNLIRWQAGEEYLVEDIARMESAKNHGEGVDKVIKMCDDAVTERELRARSSR